MAGTEADVLIRGAGPVGCTLALALRGSGLAVSLNDENPKTNSLGGATPR